MRDFRILATTALLGAAILTGVGVMVATVLAALG